MCSDGGFKLLFLVCGEVNWRLWVCMRNCFCLQLPVTFKENEQAYVSLSEVEKAYAVACEEFDEKPNGHTQIWNYAQYLSKLGVLKTEVATAETRGRTTRLSLPTIPAGELEKELDCEFADRKKGRT